MRKRNEAFARELRPAHVPEGEAVSADAQLPANTHGDRLHPCVEDMNLGVGEGAPDGYVGRHVGAARGVRARRTSGGSRYSVDQTVVSVGPYMFHTSSERSRSSRPSADGSASPPESTLRFSPRVPRVQPAARSNRHVEGVACIMVTPWARMAERSDAPSTATRREATTTLAPTTSGNSSSSTAMSNDSVVTARSTSEGAIPGSRADGLRGKLTTAR